jgi:RNA polymerase sigma-70 factor, ECF subfamily
LGSPKLVRSGHLEAWLLRTTYRLCLDAISSERRLEPIESQLADDLNPEQLTVQSDLARAVRDAVLTLPQPQRAVLILSAYEGLSYEAISSALGIPTGTVASRKNSALLTLRRRLAAWETK